MTPNPLKIIPRQSREINVKSSDHVITNKLHDGYGLILTRFLKLENASLHIVINLIF